MKPVRGPSTPAARRGRARSRAHQRAWARPRPSCWATPVEITEGYRGWWSYVPHFIASPGYVYAYAYGQAAGAVGLQALHRARRRNGPELPGAAVASLARARPRSWARSSASTSPTPASGIRLDLVEEQLESGGRRGRGRDYRALDEVLAVLRFSVLSRSEDSSSLTAPDHRPSGSADRLDLGVQSMVRLPGRQERPDR